MHTEATCAICLEVFAAPVALHPCGHIFCAACISRTLKKECPECRTPIFAELRIPFIDQLIENDFVPCMTEEERAKHVARRAKVRRVRSFRSTRQSSPHFEPLYQDFMCVAEERYPCHCAYECKQVIQRGELYCDRRRCSASGDFDDYSTKFSLRCCVASKDRLVFETI